MCRRTACAVEHVFGYNLSYSGSKVHQGQNIQIYERFKTTFSSIRARMAELEPVENYSANPLFLDAGSLAGSITVESLESLSFSFIDGSTYAYASKIFSLSKILILIKYQFKNTRSKKI
jgi:hypothetical protein